MKIYVVTKNNETVAVMDNEVSGALHFSDDEFHRYLDNGASTFDLTVAKKHRIYSNATDIEMEDFQYLVANNFLIFTYKNKDYKFTIRRVEETETSIRLFCEDLSFDLLNEYRGPHIADKAYNIAKYVNDCLYDSGYTIGINEFAKNTRTLKWEGDDTVLKRLLSICNSFDAELEFETQLNNDRTVNKQLVHLRKRVGLNRPDIELKYGREVSSIRRNVDLTELITAIKPRGHENDGKYVTIKNIAKEVKDADGNVAYFTKKGSEYLYAPMANQIYGSPEKKSGGYIVGQFSYDTESDTELYNRALTELQLKCMPAYEYEIEGFYDVDIGDTVRAIDEAYNPILMLEARISEQVISFTDPTRNKTVYSNYRVLNNLVSQSLLDRIDDVKDYAEQVARTYIFSLKNVGSSMFKNGIGEVTYTAKAEKNNKDVTSEFDSFNWTKQLKDGTPDEAWNALHVDFGTTLTVTPDDFEDTATFSYVALKGEETFGGASGVVTKVYDGEDGKTPIKGVDYFDGVDGQDGRSAYLHIRYSQNANGTPMTDDPVGAVYVGMLASQNPTPSTVPADYDWTLVKGADGIPGETGPDGKTTYLHIKYSDDGGKTFTANNGEAVGQWLGQYVDFESADSTDVSKYAWSKIKGDTGERGVAGAQGPKGDQGIAGPKGADGQTQYTHIAYANSADGTVDFSVSNADRKYIGMYVDFTATDSTTPSDYAWTLVKGADGAQGTAGRAGADGKTPYFHTAWANSADGKTGFSTTVSAGKTYLGTYTDYTQADSTDPTKYAWSLIKGDKGDTGDDGQTPVVHPAWSWSADGTDRFTTVYPGENYVLKSKEPYIATGNGTSNQYPIEIRYIPFNPDILGKEATIQYKVTISNYTSGTYLRLKMYDATGDWRSFSEWENITGNGTKLIQWKGTLLPLKDGGVPEIRFNTDLGANIKIEELCIRKGTDYYAYTPSPSEDYANAYPTYEGTYTDYSDTASNNPADYTWRRIIGESGQDGSNGISVTSVTEEYYVSTSDTEQTGGEWSTTVPNNANPNLYVWRRVKNTMSDGTVSYTTPALIQGMTGIYPYIGPTQPANPKEGQQWWKSDSNGNVTDFYVYHDGSWQGQTIQQSVLNIVALNAVNITGSSIVGTSISGATITGSEFVNTFDFLKGFDYYLRGDTTIKDAGIVINAESYQDGNVFYNQRLEYSANVGGLYVQETSPTSQLGERWVLMTPTGIGMYDGRYASTYGQVDLKYQDLMTMPVTQLVPKSGYTIYSSTGGNRPTARRNGRLVTLAGAFKNNSVVTSTADWVDMCTLPDWAIPAQNAIFVVQGSDRNKFCILVDIAGVVRWARYGDTGSVSVPAGSWLNIACVYSAADL